ncbi:MAG: hypothetical protein ACREMN_09545 [Gemmatimonadales bacterium]
MRRTLPWAVFGLLTATQLGIGVWRTAVMLRGGLASGVRPLEWSTALGLDLLMCGLLAAAAWWWLPPRGPRSAAAWGARFLLLGWALLLVHYAWALATGRLAPALTWAALAVFFSVGFRVRRLGNAPDDAAVSAAGSPAPAGERRAAIAIAALFFIAQLPHLVVPYTFTDAKLIWACRAYRLAEQHALAGILDCIDPARPPLHAVMLWLGVADPTFEGRLLPLLMFGAFVLVFHQLLRRVAPRLAPWGVVWLLATDQVVKGQISSYSGVPEMLAVVVALAVIIDQRGVTGSRGVALALGVAAGAVTALLRRDGLPEFVLVSVVLLAVTRRWRDGFAWAPLAAAAVAYASWVFRPDALQSPPLFPPSLGASAGGAYQVPAAEPTFLEHMWTLVYGAQGQVLSHYGYGAFAWSWLIVTIWARRHAAGAAGERPTLASAATLFGVAGLAGWLATLGAYAALTVLGHPHMSSLFVVRTGFGRHLVHFFPLCLLHAAARAERLVAAAAPVVPSR